MNMHQVSEFAAIGSPTARSLLQQMSKEAAEAAEQKEALAMAGKQQAATEQGQKVALIHLEIKEALEAYDEFRKQAHDALMKAFQASWNLPSGVDSRYNLEALRKTNLPNPNPGPNDELYPVFTSTEAAINQVMAVHTHAIGRSRG